MNKAVSRSACCILAWSSVLSAAAAEPVFVGVDPQILVDDQLIADCSGVVRRTHACRKLPKPVLVPAKPWERSGIDERVYVYGTVLRDRASGVFRMWYNRFQNVLFATSADGLRWERPDLGLHEFQGSAQNNILDICMHSPSVVRDETAADPAERYRMLGYRASRRRGYCAAHSPDGLHWTAYPNNPVLSSGDTCTLAQDPKTGEFLAFHKRTHTHRGHPRRLVYLATSRDMQHWSKPTLVLAPDEIDDAQTQAEGGLWSQFYNMAAFPYAGQWLGLVTHFRYSGRPAKQGPAQSSDDGPIDVQLVHSRDGRSWHRCEDRSPVINNGPHAYDAGCILGVANGPVIVDDELWFYYTAITTPHGGHLPEKKITVALARWRLDGFVSLGAGGQGGVIETVPLKISNRRLSVNADASGGSIRVEVLNAHGEPIAGYSRDECLPLNGDGVGQPARWTAHDRLPASRPIRLRFHLRNADLYSYRFYEGKP